MRDPAKNHRLRAAAGARGTRRRPSPCRPTGRRAMVFHAGQPPEIVEEMKRIWAERKGA